MTCEFVGMRGAMRLLVIEDEDGLGRAVCEHLRSAGHASDLASDLETAETALATTSYDLLLLDLGLPDGDGIDFLRRLRRGGFAPPVLITTARDRITQRIEGLKAGADDYLVKPFDLDELLARIDANLNRAHMMVTTIREFGDISIDTSTKAVFLAGEATDLTRREWGLIERLSSRPSRIFSKSELEDSFYGHGFEIESNSIEAIVSRGRAKLGKTAIVTVRGLGYRMGKA